MAATLTPTIPPPPVLNGWKEISNYLGRGIRTVQRYEVQFNLPVRRVQGKSHGAVIAFPKDLNDWLKQFSLMDAPLTNTQHSRGQMALQVHHEMMCKLKTNLQVLMEKFAEAKRTESSWPRLPPS